jgi:hypothetical protein
MNLSAAIGKGGRGRVSSDTSSDGHAIIAPVELNMFNAGPKHMNLIDHSTVGIGPKTITDRTKLPVVINNNHNNDILNKDNSNYRSDNPPITVGGKDHQAKQDALSIQQYWALTKFFRATYLLLDTLQCTKTTTSTSSTTTITTTIPATSLSSSVVTEAYNKRNDNHSNHNKYYYDYFEVDYTPSMKITPPLSANTSTSTTNYSTTTTNSTNLTTRSHSNPTISHDPSSSSSSFMINDNDMIDLTRISKHQLPCEMSITVAAKFLEAQYYFLIGHRFSLPIPK